MLICFSSHFKSDGACFRAVPVLLKCLSCVTGRNVLCWGIVIWKSAGGGCMICDAINFSCLLFSILIFIASNAQLNECVHFRNVMICFNISMSAAMAPSSGISGNVMDSRLWDIEFMLNIEQEKLSDCVVHGKSPH